MPTFLSSAFGSLIRWGLTLLLGGLVTHGIWTQVQFDNLATGLVGALLVLAWSLWQKYGAIWWQHVALNAAPTNTPTTLAEKVAEGTVQGPPAAKVLTGALGVLLAIGLGTAGLGAAVTVSGCALSTRHTAVVADVSIHTGLAALQDGEMAMFKANELAPNSTENAALHKRINKALAPALKSEDAYNRMVRNWQPGQPTPPELKQHVADLRALFNEITASFPDGPAKSKLLGWFAVAQDSALAVIVNLPVK